MESRFHYHKTDKNAIYSEIRHLARAEAQSVHEWASENVYRWIYETPQLEINQIRIFKIEGARVSMVKDYKSKISKERADG